MSGDLTQIICSYPWWWRSRSVMDLVSKISNLIPSYRNRIFVNIIFRKTNWLCWFSNCRHSETFWWNRRTASVGSNQTAAVCSSGREAAKSCSVNGTYISLGRWRTIISACDLVGDARNLGPCESDWNVQDGSGSWCSWLAWNINKCWRNKCLWPWRFTSSIISLNSEMVFSCCGETFETSHATHVLSPDTVSWFLVLTLEWGSLKLRPWKNNYSLGPWR